MNTSSSTSGPGREAPRAGAAPARAHVVRLVEYRGLLPEQPAAFLGRLSAKEKQDVYALLGTFHEVRALVGTARLLHAFLREAPLAAARGRTTFQEFLAEKESIQRDIRALREKVNRAAANVCRMLPRVPQLRNEEEGHDLAAAL